MRLPAMVGVVAVCWLVGGSDLLGATPTPEQVLTELQSRVEPEGIAEGDVGGSVWLRSTLIGITVLLVVLVAIIIRRLSVSCMLL